MSEQKKHTILIRLKEGVDPSKIIPANNTENFFLSSNDSGNNLKLNRLHSIKSVVEREKKDKLSLLEANVNDEKIFEQAYKNMSETEKKLYRTYKIKIDNNVDIDYLLDNLNQNDDVEFADIDKPLALYMTPTDHRFPKMYNLKNIHCQEAWDISQGEGVIVAVIDSGVDYNHPDIKASMWQDENGKHGYDFSGDMDTIDDNDIVSDSDPMDVNGHGTHVAGTIAAAGNNEIGIIGVAPKAKIMSLKIFPNAFDSTAATALRFAVDNGAKVLNNSWGPEIQRPENEIIQNALDYVYKKGAIAIFAAGNENDDTRYYSPANYKKTISVSAVDKNDKRASFSNYGNIVDVAAPGVTILSLKAGTSDYVSEDFSGTSMAAPHVSGLVALLLSKKPTLTFTEIKKILRESSDEIHTDKPIGTGRINAYKALTHPLLEESTSRVRELVGMK
ncbi:S8 family peptidase [Clostridium saccharoperbutylacetonicum]|uniref:S8 family peptidase n=1 Tax=Clostridium saccharoperbutylacetonicum TaxID=36745 RepID=UPI000983E072|nr:S8 family peptidase [Clostridium saccharoperbutylacetonicum]AQR93672.1 thermophilic serine proteinase precursor [Clostridium saccharoperbutylacetonicum]NSB29371.1 thermitase [Clostridium saccharoperbutylacetonicum]